MEYFGPLIFQKDSLILYFKKGFIGHFLDGGGGGGTGRGSSPP